MKNKIKIFILSIISVSTQSYAGGSSTVGPANPAAVNCVKLGGDLERVQTPGGQDANCVIEQWQLYREMYERGLVKPRRYKKIGMPNPAAVNCIDIKGTLRSENSPEGQYGLCVVRQWDLIRAINVTAED